MLKSVYDPDNNGIVREIPYRLAASETTLKDAGGTGWYCGQTEYLLMKSITVPKNYIVAGSIRVKFQIQQSTVDNTACGKVYKNDVPIGTEFCTGQGIAGTSQDFSNIKAGDKIQLWGKTTSGGCIMVHHFRTAGDSVLIPPSW